VTASTLLGVARIGTHDAAAGDVQIELRASSPDAPDLVHEPALRLTGSNGISYRVRICGCRETEGVWVAWIEFLPLSADLPELRTGIETVQPNRAALAYWAARLSHVYVDSAFALAGGRSGSERQTVLIHEHASIVQDNEDRLYSVRTYAAVSSDGNWVGWLEYVPHGVGPTLRTNREITQPSRQAISLWAARLERPFLERALRRARPAPPP
jgi:hypothetical protein